MEERSPWIPATVVSNRSSVATVVVVAVMAVVADFPLTEGTTLVTLLVDDAGSACLWLGPIEQAREKGGAKWWKKRTETKVKALERGGDSRVFFIGGVP